MQCRKPKILIVGSIPPPFIGPNIAIKNLLAAQNIRQSFEVLFLDISDRRPAGNIGRLDWINILLAFRHISKFLEYLLIEKPHLVYFAISQGLWGYIRDLGFFIPSVVFRKKIIIHLRGSEFDEFYKGFPRFVKFITRFLFRRVAYIIVLSEKLRDIFKSLVEAEKVVVIPNGIDYTQFPLNENMFRVESKSSKRVLYLSSLVARKGILQFIDAVPFIIQKHPYTKFTIVGEWQNHEDKIMTMQTIERNNLFAQVSFTGEVFYTRAIKLYQDHDIFVFTPIKPEGMPWVILEAMSAGLPVITSDQGAIVDVVEDGRTGFVVDSKPEQIAEKVCYLIEHPETAKKMGENGRRRIETHFSQEIYLKKIENVFFEATNNTIE